MQNPFNPPDSMTSDLAYFIGSIMGDGCLHCDKPRHDYQIVFTSKDLSYCERVRLIIKKYVKFRKKVTPQIYCVKGAYQFTIRSKLLYMWLMQVTANKQHVPDIILNGCPEIKGAFLRGVMDSEGSFVKQGNFFHLSFRIKDNWIKEVHRLFRDLGVVVSEEIKTQHMVTHINGQSYDAVQHYFYIDIPSYIDAGIGFSLERKKHLLREYIDKRLRGRG